MRLRAVVFTHGSSEAAARDRRRAAGGAALGRLDDAYSGLRAFECSHGSGCAATDDQNVGLVANDWNVEPLASV
jgi:hypothetical protein